MNTSMIAVLLHCLFILMALLALKKNTHLYQKRKTLNSAEAAALKKVEETRVELQILAASISRCSIVVLMLKNFSFFNPFCKQAPSRAQLLLLTYSVTSLYLCSLDIWLPSFALGSFLSFILLAYELLEYSRTAQLTGSELAVEEGKSIMRSEIFGCVAGIVTIGICLFLVSVLYKSPSDGVSRFFFRFGMAILADSLVMKPVSFIFATLACGNRTFLVTALSLRESGTSNKLKNQFYRTSQSEANVNDSMGLPKDTYFLEEIDIPTQNQQQTQKVYEPQPIAIMAGNNSNDSSQEARPFPKHSSTRDTENIKQNSTGKQVNDVSVQKELTSGVLSTRRQPALEEPSEVIRQHHPFFGIRSQTGQNSFKGRKRPRQSTKAEVGSNRIIQIYGDQKVKSQLDLDRSYKKRQHRPLYKGSQKRSAEQGRRNNPIVHEFSSSGLPQIIIATLLNSPEVPR